MRPNDPMVSVEWLANNIGKPDVVTIDATWSMPGNDDPYPNTFIESVRFDINAIADPTSGFAHTLPSEDQFETAVRKLGISNKTHIIVYDRHGLLSAPRAWWMFRVMGHEKINVLDGGLPAWIAAGHPTVNTFKHDGDGDFVAEYQPDLYKKTDEMHEALHKSQILDARAKGRFNGTAPEPRAGLSSGHMPGASSIPFSELKTPDGFLKQKADLRDVFAARQIDLQEPIITTCGSGITACGIAISLARLGAWQAAVYDGSWTEWASTQGCPIDKVEG